MDWTPTHDPENRPRWRVGSSRVRHATIAAAAIVAGGTMYASAQQKKAAAKAAKAAGQPSTIDQTSTTTQTGWAPAQDQLQYALDQTRAMYDAGPVTRLGGGKVQYETRPDGRVVPVGGKPGKGGGGGGGGKGAGKGGAKGGAKAPTAKQQQKDIAQKITDTAMAGAPNQKAADDYVGRVLEEGSIGGNEVNQDLYERLKGSDLGSGEDLLTNFLGGSNGGNAQLGGPAGKFMKVSAPLMAPLAGGQSPDALRRAEEGRARAQVAGVAARAPGGGAFVGGQQGVIPDSTTRPGTFNDWARGAMAGEGLTNADGPGAFKDWTDMSNRIVSGELLAPAAEAPIQNNAGLAEDGTFNDWSKEVLGGKYLDPNDPALKDYLDMQQRRGQEGLDAQLQDVADEFEGVGMYGGSGLALERAMARSRGLQGIADERTASIMGYRGQGLGLMGEVGGLVNQRDMTGAELEAMERQKAADRGVTQRGQTLDLFSDVGGQLNSRDIAYRGQGLDYRSNAAGLVNQRDISAGQIASSEREGAANRSASASASSNALAASSNALAGQMQIANRGMDLQAIQSYLQNKQFGVGQLADLGRGVSADRLGALDRMKGLEDVRYGGLNTAFGVQGNLRQQDDAAAAAARANQLRRDELAYQDRLAPGRHLDEYLNRLGFFNSAGGTSSTRTTGTTTNPGGAAPYIANAGPSPVAAGIAAGAGTYFQGLSYQQPRQQPPPRVPPGAMIGSNLV